MPNPQFIPMLAEFQRSDLLLAGGLILIIMGLMWKYKKRRRIQATTPHITPIEQLERNKQLRGVRGDLESLMVEIEQFSKRLSSHLDSKTIAIEMLIKQADQRIAELKRMAKNNGPVEETPAPNPAPMPLGETQYTDSRPAHAIEATPDQPDDPLSRSVYQLADSGLPPDAIAKKLNEHVGKIELILALRRA